MDTLEILNKTKFPKCYSRPNIAKNSEMFCLGSVPYRGQKSVGNKTRGDSKWNNVYPELYEQLKRMISEFDTNFTYTTIQINKNITSPPHVDKNNVGPSYIIALGDYEGGELFVEGQSYNIKNKFFKFDGKKGHWTAPFVGTRYSIIFFTHTFKPPNPSLRYLEVKEDGLYNRNVLIKSYPSGEASSGRSIKY